MTPEGVKTPWLAVAAALVFAAALFLLGDRLDRDRETSEDARVATQAKEALESSARTAGSQLEVLAASMTGERQASELFVSARSALLENPGLIAVSFTSRLEGSERASFEARVAPVREIRSDGLERAPQRASYWVVSRVAASSGARRPTPVGLNVGADPIRRDALERAAATGEAVASEPFTVEGEASYVAVYAPAGGRGEDAAGFLGGTYHLERLAAAVGELLPDETALDITAGRRLIAGAGEAADGTPEDAVFAGRTWQIHVDAPPRAAIPLAFVLPALGIVLAALVFALLSSARRRERYAKRLVEKRMRERDAAEANRQRAEQEFTATFDESPIGIALVAIDGRFLSVNRSLCEILGRPEDELLELTVMDLSLSDNAPDEPDAARRMVRGDLRHYKVEKRYLAAGGRPVWLSVNAVLIRDRTDRPHHFLAHVEDVTERRNMRDRLQQLADLDELTGVLNRRGFNRELERKLHECERYGTSGSLLLLDLDDMKAVNDSFGHASGDMMLMSTADALRDGLRKSDILGRVGGDEFAVILPRGAEEEAAHTAGLLLARLAKERRPGDGRPVAASVGVVAFQDLVVLTPESAMNAADLAMYEAKRAGGQQLSIWDG